MTVQLQSVQFDGNGREIELPVNARSKQNLRLCLYSALLVLDILALLIGPLAAAYFLANGGSTPDRFMSAGAVLVIYLALALARGCYSIQALSDPLASVRMSIFSFGYAAFLVLMVAFFLKTSTDISRLNFGVGSLISLTLLVLARAYFPRYARRICGGHLVNTLYVVHDRPVGDHLRSASISVLDIAKAGLEPNLNDPAMLDQFGTIIAGFDRVIVNSAPQHHRAWALILKGANINGEIVFEQENEIGVIGIGRCGNNDTMVVSRHALSLHNRLQKRILDIVVASSMLIFLGPLMLLTAIAIKLDSPGPVFFRQPRVGRGNRMIKVLKFRSMRADDCDMNGSRSTSRADDRITRVGRFIRATSIDELPQLLNVLKGDMSIVGPRPHALGSTAGSQLFWHIDETYWLRHQLKPGITGLAQMRGHRGATLHASDLVNRLQSDMEYIQGWSIWRDMAIIVGTAKVLVHRNAF